VAFRNGVVAQRLEDRFGQAEKPHRVGDGRATFAHPFRHLLLCEPKLVHQGLVGRGSFQRADILPLDVFDKGKF